MKCVAGIGAGLALGAVVLACTGSDPIPDNTSSSSGGTSSSSGGTSSSSGSSTSSGSTSSSSSSSGGAVAGELLLLGDFESTGCNGWDRNSVTAELNETEKYSGKSSCQVCQEVGLNPGSWALYQSTKTLSAGIYTVSAFVHSAPTRAINKVFIVATRVKNGEETPLDERAITLDPGLPWQATPFDVEIADGEGISVAAVGNSDGCILVDNFSLVKKQ